MPLKIVTWNVNGIRARNEQLRDFVTRERPDVLCLQEIKAATAQVPAELCALDGYWCYFHGERAYSGVALIVSKSASPERPVFFHPDFDHENRIAVVTLGAITVASVYVPNGGKNFPAKIAFLESMIGYAGAQSALGKRLVICGDINVARAEIDVHPKERKATAIGQLPEERVLFERLLATGLVDVGRALHPADDQLFTWWAPWRNLRQRNIGWRIDYILASPAIAELGRDFASHRETGTSDHAPVAVTFDLPV